MTAQTTPRPGRNEPCYCGSGKKYKHCCLAKDEKKAATARAKAAKAAAEAPAPVEAEGEAAAPAAPKRPPKPMDQPWRMTSSRGFVPKNRTPRKVGGS